jgi:hypothetical protein
VLRPFPTPFHANVKVVSFRQACIWPLPSRLLHQHSWSLIYS